MTLATVGTDARPSTRIVLVKGFDARGIVWFTNYESRKGRELALHPVAALQFHWVELERVVRIEGRVCRKKGERLSKGATFGVDMKLFGLPYKIRNTVVEFEEGRRVDERKELLRTLRRAERPEARPDAAGEDDRPERGLRRVELELGFRTRLDVGKLRRLGQHRG